MLVVLLFMILGLAGFCMLASDDLLRKTDTTIHSWIIVLFFVGAIVGCLFICKDGVRTESIKDFTEGKYRLEEIVQSDTTYIVKKNKPNHDF
jgi:hypothetical protein